MQLSLIHIFNSLVYATVGVIGAFLAIRGSITDGQLSSLLSYANQYTKPFNEISGVITELQNALACAARVFELIEEPVEKPDAESAKVLEKADGSVELSHVYFSYTPEQKLIEDFNLSVQPGQRVAIVGPKMCIRDRNTTDKKEKRRHILIYNFKVYLVMVFCVAVVTLYSKLTGSENSVVGVTVLLAVLVLRQADFGIKTTHGLLSVSYTHLDVYKRQRLYQPLVIMMSQRGVR